jgi:hypothetical protein
MLLPGILRYAWTRFWRWVDSKIVVGFQDAALGFVYGRMPDAEFAELSAQWAELYHPVNDPADDCSDRLSLILIRHSHNRSDTL